jgi:hypothetical protein
MHGRPLWRGRPLAGPPRLLRKPYACSGVAASALAADKALCKLALAGLGVPTPRWCHPGEDPARFLARYGQVMVKPRMGGSSVGMSLVSRGGDLDAAISQAAATDGLEPVLEEYVAGDPVTVGLLQLPAGVIVLPPLATRPRHAAFYDAGDVAGDRRPGPPPLDARRRRRCGAVGRLPPPVNPAPPALPGRARFSSFRPVLTLVRRPLARPTRRSSSRRRLAAAGGGWRRRATPSDSGPLARSYLPSRGTAGRAAAGGIVTAAGQRAGR